MLVFLTGSRFRSDSKPIPHIQYTTLEDTSETGQIITRYSPVTDYEFTIQDAWQLKEPPIKRVMYKEATSKAFLVEEENGQEIEYTPEVFFAKAESDREWFRKILLADSFCLPVLEKAVEILTQKRGTGQPHAMIVRALNIPHAHRLYQLLQNFPILKERVGLVHSEKEGFDLAGKPSASYQRFFSGEYICLVHCGMVGEGFSHPWASVEVSLCIMKSLTVAEQEFGRIVRRVPGRPPGNLPDLTHENWGVVVSHEALGIRDIFLSFLEGQKLAPLSGYGEEEIEVILKPIIETEYSAGENVIKFNDTSKLKAGDIIVLNLPAPPVNNTRTQTNSKFNLASELKQSGSLTNQIEQKSEERLLTATKSVSESKGLYNVFKNAADEVLRAIQPDNEKVASPSLQDKICDAIVERMNQIRNTRTVSIRVEAVLDNRTIQILPQSIDLPVGTSVVRKQISRTKEEVKVNFIGHLGLDWMVMVDGITMPFQEYKRRTVLKQKGFALDENGEILAGGMRLRDTMPPSTYATFIKELEIDIEHSAVIPPHPAVSCRPDEIKRQNATKYGAAISSSIYKLLDQKWLIPDSSSGKSLIDNPLECLLPLMVRESELEESNGVVNPDAIQSDFYKNNGQMLHKVVFAYIKRQTGKKWGIHESISEYELAVKVAKELLVTVRSELIERRGQY
ncbi:MULTISPECIES: hypothetical protein [Aerosakkonema]|uniref:hypothetical protein n=1 Tax=Aerosakkonema TaxID=1246629 RepID=UPI0035BA9AED